MVIIINNKKNIKKKPKNPMAYQVLGPPPAKII